MSNTSATNGMDVLNSSNFHVYRDPVQRLFRMKQRDINRFESFEIRWAA